MLRLYNRDVRMVPNRGLCPRSCRISNPYPPDESTVCVGCQERTLGDVVRAFKSLSAIHVNRLLRRSGPLWQRNYYEHVIRNERELDKIREYIATNPLKWALDRENPQRTGSSPVEDSLFDLDHAP
jgi:hypothetical protein